jgi:molecular chaperone DnaK
MKKLLIGIDLGTTYSCAAILNEAGTIEIAPNSDDGKNTTPSVFYLKKGSDNALVGNEAKSSLQGIIALKKEAREQQMRDGWYAHPKETRAVVEQAKRFIGTDKTYEFNESTYNPTIISAAILKKIKQDVEIYYGQEVDEAVITIPAKWDNQARQETVKAANSIGLNVQHIINEPTAAALAYSVKSQIDGIYAVYDFGGGTFDCSIVETKGDEVKILGNEGVKKLGGKDLDLKLLGLVEKKYKDATNKELSPRQWSIIQAEQLKISLSSITEVEIFIDGEEIIITRKEFEAEISTLVSLSMLSFDNAIEDAKISVDNIMDVILVGGSSRIPLVKRELKKKIGKAPKSYGNPDETVAKGAAIYIALKNKKDLNINQKAVVAGFEVKEMTNVYLGTLYNDEDEGVLKNKNIIKKGSRIPSSRTEEFSIPHKLVLGQLELQANNQHIPDLSFTARVTESETDETKESNVKVVWKKKAPWPIASISDLRSYSQSEEGISDFLFNWVVLKIKYSIDNNQIFHIKVRHPESNSTLIDEKVDMKKGSLSVKDGKGSKDSIDKFKID